MSEIEKNVNASSSWPTGGAGVCRLDEGAPGEIAMSGTDAIRAAIRKKYAEVAVSAAGKFAYPTGREGAGLLGYDPEVLRTAPEELLKSFCGVGNPLTLGSIATGSAVLDFGCGAGFDLFAASRTAGGIGRFCGVDLTRDMADRARKYLSAAGVSNFEIREIDSEKIPYADESFDIVISNGVINLCPDKGACFRELFRILKSGGRIQFADVVLEKELPAEMAASPEAWSQWIGGTIPVGDQLNLLKQAGFTQVEFKGATGFRTSQYTVGALFTAKK